MMRPRDPRIRQRINQISHNLESANETAQEGLYAFSHNYISPCFASIGSCVAACTAPCLPSREDHLRRRRRGRTEANFDFYDDWENEEEEDSLLGWGNGELDRLLAGSGLARGNAEQPRRPRRMSYGTRNTRRRSTVHIPDNHADPTVIPSSSFIGFLERFPWRFGARGVKYRPSAADLQEHPGTRRYAHEDEPLMEAMDDEAQLSPTPAGRNRSATQSSRGTSNSLSSRGDLFPSDEEEDAVPLDDEFAFTFTRRGTGLESDDQSGAKSELTKSGSASSLGGASSKKNKRKNKRRTKRFSSPPAAKIVQSIDTPSMADLKTEDQRAALEEEAAIESRRLAAQELALSRGLDMGAGDMTTTKSTSTNLPLQNEDKQSIPQLRRFSDSSGQEASTNQTEPFPPLSLSPSSVILESQGLSKASPRALSPHGLDDTNSFD
ncbi:uncharacterized protein N7446_002997 [Penicillium canescens]|uniref:Uncharacterized protein n=1 Tax=Penicillium canescens TaxID=5083 RepID=A0AAD6N9Y2_PENCN|nr:uncharacterized protein N7446_002997 [Penicillium canescens]KAJ6044803.1 hypothetical protein N7460_006158 [Penicillium canescens]KAJ6056272.1 hypothetical protein N7444_005370 [Penicillium canescens]KAJ6075220.1 hypothetical protein N7446_002997 [Penicillium canescens]